MNKSKVRLNNIAEYKEKRRLLRNNSTPAEAVMWQILKGDKLLGTRWRRQFSVGPYILDFYCPSLKLAIELDGALHYTDSGYHHDSVRENFLSDLGIEVLRFENKTIWNGQEAIIESVTRKIEERLKNSPSKLEGVPFMGEGVCK